MRKFGALTIVAGVVAEARDFDMQEEICDATMDGACQISDAENDSVAEQ